MAGGLAGTMGATAMPARALTESARARPKPRRAAHATRRPDAARFGAAAARAGATRLACAAGFVAAALRPGTILLACAALLVVGRPATADGDERLYLPEPPPSSAFVRWLLPHSEERSSGVPDAPPRIDAVPVPAAAWAAAPAYVVVAQGLHRLRVPGDAGPPSPARFEAGAFYSVVARPGDALRVLRDPPGPDRSRAALVLYNLSDAARASLVTSEQALSVVDGVAPGELGARSVNAVRIGLDVRADGRLVRRFPDIVLERGRVHSFVVEGSARDEAGGTLRARAFDSRTRVARD